MRIRDLADKEGVAGRWHSRDGYSSNSTTPYRYRAVYHYSTEMVWFTLDDEGQFDDRIIVPHLGHGSKSDQDGISTIMARIGGKFRMLRDGNNARLEKLDARPVRYGITDLDMHGWRFAHNDPPPIDEAPSDWARWVVS